MADIRINALPLEPSPTSSEFLAIDGASTRKTTIQSVVDAGAPIASQAEAQAGTNAVKRMTPLTTKQSIASEVGVTIAGPIGPNLTGIKALTTAANKVPIFTDGSGGSTTYTVSTFVQTASAAPDNESFADAAGVVVVGASVDKLTYTPDIVGAFPRPALRKMRDTLGALDLMASGGLDTALRNREADFSDATEVTALFQEAMSECAEQGWSIAVPDATYPLNARLSVTKPLSMKGGSMGGTRLQWQNGAASSGIKVAVSASPRTSVFEDMSLETFGVAVGTALELDNSGLISGGVIVPRAETHTKVNRLFVKGATGYTVNGWLTGIDAISTQGLDVSYTRLNGVYTGAYGSMPQSAQAIRFRGLGSPVQLTSSNATISAWQDAVLTEDAEGIYIDNFEFVTVGCGLRTNNVLNESGLVLTDGHIASLAKGVDLQKMAEWIVKDIIFYNVVDNNVTYVTVREGCRGGQIRGNSFRRIGSVSVTLPILVEAGVSTQIGRNVHDIGTSNKAIQIEAAAVDTFIDEQDYITCSSTPIVNLSSSTQSKQFNNFSGDLNAIKTNFQRVKQVHTLTSGCANGPTDTITGAAVSTAGAILETISYDANTAEQSFTSPVEGKDYLRRKTGGTWASSWGPLASENGTTSNGKYTKFADGTLVCTHSLAITSVVGSTVSATWTFPVPSIISPEVVLTNVPSASLGNIFSSASAKTATTAQINLRRNDTAVLTAVEVTMIGRWK